MVVSPVSSVFKLDGSLGFDLNHAGSTLLCKFHSLLGMVLLLQASW